MTGQAEKTKTTSNVCAFLAGKIPLYAAIAALSPFVFTAPVLAGPEGGEVIGGHGSIGQSGSTTTIHQTTHRMAIDWQSFNVGSEETVQYFQPDSSSISLNRILSHRGSEIHGNIIANGNVFLVNPNGVVFGRGAQVNVGGLLASGLSIDANDFMNGRYALESLDGTSGYVINQGTILAATGGSISLVGKQVSNEGLIRADLGRINLASGNKAVLSFDGGLLGVRVSEAVLQEELGVEVGVLNSGDIEASGGQVLLSGAASHDIFTGAINSGGMSHGTSIVVDENGNISLSARGSNVLNTGTINSSSENFGGEIVVIGQNVTNSGAIHANAISTEYAQAGAVELHSIETTELTKNSVTTANSYNSGIGGDVKLLGKNVGLLNAAMVEASGSDGGGQVLIGGDRTGKNPYVRNANFVYVGENTRASADGLINGNGGKLITFSNDTTRIYGELTARGGYSGGDGGFVETSGLVDIEIRTSPIVGAPQGGGGEWLIDPYNITIVAGNEETSASHAGSGINRLYVSSGDGAKIGWDLIEDFLDGGGLGSRYFGGSVTIQTAGESSQEGDIVFDLADGGETAIEAMLDENSDDRDLVNSRLILNAGHNIEFKNQSLSVDQSGDLLHLELIAGNDILFTGNSVIDLGGGSFTATATNGDFTLGSATSGSSITTGGGDFSVTAGGNVTIFDSIRSGGGTLSITGNSFTNIGEGISSANTLTISSETTAALGSITTSSSGALTVNSNSGITQGSGFLTVAGLATFNSNWNDGNATAANITLDSNFNGFNNGVHIAHGHDVEIVTVGSINLGVSGQTFTVDGTLSVTALSEGTILDDSALHVTGAATFNTEGNTIYLDSNNDFRSSVHVTGSYVYINDTAGGLQLGDSSSDSVVTNTLIAETVGSITQAGSLIVTNATTLTAGSGQSIDVSNVGNIFSGTINVDAQSDNLQNVSISDTTALTLQNNLSIDGDLTVSAEGVIFSNTTVGGTLIVTATGDGSITAQADYHLNITETSSFTALGREINLSNYASNTFGGVVTADTHGENPGDAGGNIILAAQYITVGNVSSYGADNAGAAGGNAGTITVHSTRNTSSGVAITTQGAIDAHGGAGDITGDSATITLRGDGGANAFNINSGTSWQGASFTVNGLNGNNTFNINTAIPNININGGNDTDTFNINAAVSGDFRGGGGIDTFNIDASAGNLYGEAGEDNFNLRVSGVTADIDGGDNADTIAVSHSDNSAWLLESEINGGFRVTDQSSSPGRVDFENVDALVGNNANDTFTVNENFGGTITANNGENTFNLNANVSGLIQGGSARDEINVRTVNITLSNGLNSGGGADEFNLAYSVATGILNGGDGADQFDIETDGISIASIDGGGNGGADIINIAHGGNSLWTLNGSGQYETVDNVNFQNIETANGGSGRDTFSIATNADVTNANGLGGDDVFNLTSTSITVAMDGGTNSDSGTRDVANYSSVGGDITVNLGSGSGVVSGVETYIGNGRSGTTLSRSTSAFDEWRITDISVDLGDGNGDIADGINDGTITDGTTIISFVNFGQLDGGATADQFTLTSTGSFSGIIAGGSGGTNVLIQERSGQSWTLDQNADFAGQVNGTSFEQVQTIQGSGSDSLQGRDKDTTWTLIGSSGNTIRETSDTDGSEAIFFSGMSTLTGNDSGSSTDKVDRFVVTGDFGGIINAGEGDDRFTVNSAFSGNYNGQDNDDIFIIAATAANGSVFGGAGNNTLETQVTTGSNAWSITGENIGTLTNTGVVSFHGVSALVGSTGIDTYTFDSGGLITGSIDGGATALNTITGRDIGSTWTLTNRNLGYVVETVRDIRYVQSFQNIQNLTGQSGSDVFSFTRSGAIEGSVSGTITGGDGAEDSMSYAQITGTVSINLSNGLGNNIVGVESLVGNGANGTLQGANVAQQWNITDINTGNVGGVNFSAFANLIGGRDDDNFVFEQGASTAGRLTGHLTGGDQSVDGDGDTANYSALTQTQNISFHATTGNISNIENIIGNMGSLTGDNAASDWRITGANAGSLNNSTTFSNISSIIGGRNDDTFIIQTTDTIAMTMSGGDHSDNDTVNVFGLTNNNITVGSTIYGVTGIERVVGDGSTSTLNETGTDSNTWAIDGVNRGSVDGFLFVGFNRLVGSSGDDIFNVQTGGSITGYINGGDQDAQDTISYSDSVDITVAGSFAQDVQVFNVERITANGGLNVLRAYTDPSPGSDRWVITSSTGGTLNGDEFFGFNQLFGSDNNDRFIFETNFIGTIDAGEHRTRDIADYSQLATVNVTLGSTGVDNVERLVGAGATSTLNAVDGTNVWQIDDVNEGSVSGIEFEAFGHLIGGSGDDSFQFMNSDSALGGTIIGGGNGTNGDSVDYRLASNVDVQVGTVAGEGIDVVGIEDIQGGGTGTLRGANGTTNTWIINEANGGDLEGMGFSGFSTIVGGDGDDTFTFYINGSISNTIDAGGHSSRDTVNVANVANANINLASTTIFGVANVERIVGNSVNNILTGANITNDWNITANNRGDINGLNFEGFNQLVGGSDDDKFHFSNGVSITGSVSAGAHEGGDILDLADVITVDITLGATLYGVSGIEHIIGNGSGSTLTTTDTATTVQISGVNQGQVVGGPSFENFTALAGGAGSDTFIFTTATASIVSGINGYGESTETDDPGDTVNLSALTNANITAGILYSNIETFIGNTNASITASESASNRWEITGSGSGSLNGVAFQNFGSLVGSNTQDDRFVFYEGGSVSGSIDGRGENRVDTVDVSNLANAAIIVGSTLFGVSNAERVVGDNSSTSITASDGAEHRWQITGENDGTIEGLSFVNVANLVGGDDDDSFLMTSSLSAITGSINGGGASTRDTLNYGPVTNVDVTLNQDVINVAQITANNGVLRVFNSDADELNTWDIDGENTGILNRTRFIGFNQLHGNNNDDTFTLRESANITGSVDAGGQQNRDTVNLSNLSTIAITLGRNVQGVTNAERIIGNGNDSTLIGNNSGQAWLITARNTGSVGGISFEGFNNITGGSGDDTFTVQATGNITGEIDGGVHDENGGDAITFMTTGVLRIELENDLTNIETVTGNGANSTLVGLDAGGSWVIDGANSGTVSGVRFNQFATLEGGDGIDTFSLTGGRISNQVRGGGSTSEDTVVAHNQENAWIVSGENSGSVDGINSFTGIERLSGNAKRDTFTINAAFGGDIEGLGDSDIFNFHANTTNTVDGGDGDDEFILHQSGLTVSVDGEAGEDIVEMRFSDAVEWTINGGDNEQARDSNNGVFTFDSIAIANAGAGIDTFNISVSSATELRGGDSADIYNIISSENLALTLDGEAGADQLVAANRGNDWRLNQAQNQRDNENPNTLNGTIEFHRFEELDGNASDDSFTVAAGASITDIDGNTGSNALTVANAAGANIRWEINALNAGLVTGIVSSFSHIQNLIGGEGSDQFVLMNAAADISGLIDGNVSRNAELMANDSLDVTALIDGVSIELGRDISSDNLHLSRIETITAAEDIDLGDSVDTEQKNVLISQRSESMNWTITERNSGRVDPSAGAQLEQQVVFNHFGSIQGGVGSDTFFLTGSGDVTGMIDGGDGDGIDIANLSESTEALEFVIGRNLSIGTNISGLEGLIGNNNGLDSDAPSATLRVESGTNTWAFENTENHFIAVLTDGINDGYFDDGSGGAPEFYFTDFNQFEGGSGQDTFYFVGDASVTGNIDGGDNPALNPDTVDARQRNGNFIAQIDGDEFGVLNLSNIERILANDNERNNTLRASNENSRVNNWVINGTNAGEINDRITFDGFNNLSGGQGDDTFFFNAQDIITGLIDGAGGVDSLSLVDLADQHSISVVIGRDAPEISDLNVVDVETINANADNQNTLIGNNRMNTWVIDGINNGELREEGGDTIAFTGFENLTGGNQNDTFILDSNDEIRGLINGGAEPAIGQARDILNITQLNRNASVTVGGDAAEGLSVAALEEINANASFTNTLNADDARNAWNIGAADSGQLNGLQFTAFSNIVGGNQNDTFTFAGSGAISDGLDGGSQEDQGQDTVNMALLSEVSVSIGESNTNGDFTGIERYIGNGRNSTLTAADQSNTWVFEGEENSGKINSVINFEDFNNVVGGRERDTFTFSGGSITGTILAGDGNDTLMVDVGSDRSGEVSFNGQAGDDTVSITGGNTNYLTDYRATSQPNDNGGRLSYTHTEEAMAYDVTFAGVAFVNDAVISETLTIHDVSGQADTLSLLNNAFVLNTRTQVTYGKKNNIVFNGETEDLVSIDGALSIDGRFEVQRASVEMGVNGDRLRAQDVHFINNAYIGRDKNPVVLRTNNLSLDSIAGAVYIDEFDQLTMTNFDSPNDYVSINAGGSITATTKMVTVNTLRLVSRDGDITLNNNGHVLTGRLDLVASSGNIDLTNSESLTLGDVSARNLSLTVEGKISDTTDSDIRVAEETRLTAQQTNGETTNINLGNGSAHFATLEIVHANAVQIIDQSELTVSAINADGTVNVHANNLTVHGHVQGDGIQLNGGTAAVGLQSSMTSGDGLIVSGGSFFQGSESILIIETDIRVNVDEAVVMESESRSTSLTGNITIVAGLNINIASLVAETGGVALYTSTGAIVDSNGDSLNVSAQSFDARAANGVGVNDKLELAVDRIMVNSNRNQISLTNTRALLVEHLRTNGNIDLHIADGDLTLDGTEVADFDPLVNDANTQGAVINANYSEGSVNISIDQGNLFAIGQLSQRQPDIVAREAVVFNFPQGEIGSSIRPLSIYVRDSLALIGFRSWAPEWAFRSRPSVYENSSTIQADARQLLQLVGELVIEVEEAYEINPAIFTDVYNYLHDANSIRLPSDQIYEFDDNYDGEWEDDESDLDEYY